MNTSETHFSIHPFYRVNKLDNNIRNLESNVTEKNNLESNIRNSEPANSFIKQILKFIRPSPNSAFNVHNPHRIKMVKVICVNTNLDTSFKTV